MHGDEPSGRQLLLAFLEHLCAQYKRDALVTQLVDSMHLLLVPAANPDGFAARKRDNANGVDLNRDFPDPQQLAQGQPRGKDSSLWQGRGREQPETKALMDLGLAYHCVASISLHEGALVASYPMDGYSDASADVRGIKNPAPDDATFMMLARTYARLHATMGASKEFKEGITNGAQWYPLYGGLQDWTYLSTGCMEVTLELNDNKWPRPSRLPGMWQENERALVEYPLRAVFGGVHGYVLDQDGVPIPHAGVQVEGLPLNTTADELSGYFARPLAPGTYTLVCSAFGYITIKQQVTVPEQGWGPVAAGAPLGANVTLVLPPELRIVPTPGDEAADRAAQQVRAADVTQHPHQEELLKPSRTAKAVSGLAASNNALDDSSSFGGEDVGAMPSAMSMQVLLRASPGDKPPHAWPITWQGVAGMLCCLALLQATVLVLVAHLKRSVRPQLATLPVTDRAASAPQLMASGASVKRLPSVTAKMSLL